MILQPGDKVRFLNEKGEGIVKSFINSKIVNVEIDGFEIPMPVNQIVKLGEDGKIPAPVLDPSQNTREKKTITGNKGVFLAIEPQDGLFSNSYNIWLINNTHLQVLFSSTIRKSNGYYGIASGVCESAELVLIKQALIGELKEWLSINLQLIFYEKGLTKTFMPLEKQVEIKVERFKQINLLKKAPVSEVSSFLYSVADFNEISVVTGKMIEESFSAKSFHEKMKSDNFLVKEFAKNRQNLRINPKNGYMEVDLHIEELLDDYSGMSNAEIVNIQLNHCRKALDIAIQKKSGKLTIIHGVGNGTLKSEVRRLIKSYGDFECYDAPIEKYGYGATEVDLKI